MSCRKFSTMTVRSCSIFAVECVVTNRRLITQSRISPECQERPLQNISYQYNLRRLVEGRNLRHYTARLINPTLFN